MAYRLQTTTMFAILFMVTCLESVGSQDCPVAQKLATKPFIVVWNHPSFGCEDHGIHIDFEKWGILNNHKDRFIGDKIALFYHSKFGKWPSIDSKGNLHHGGVPQSADMKAHLAQVRSDIEKEIPDKSFCGLGVIDQELWRPVYETNWSSFRKYQYESIRLVQEREPTITRAEATIKAEREFNAAAKRMMVKTLKLAKKMRPNAKWGYYLFPQTWTPRNRYTQNRNDEHDWLWRVSTGIYPSIYFFVDHKSYSVEKSQDEIAREIAEAFRIRHRDSSQDVPVLVYTLSQNGPYHFYNEAQLSQSLGQPADMGVEGVVIWGASADLNKIDACQDLKNHTEHVLGPYVQRLIKFFEDCKEQHCHGNGRCVKSKWERFYDGGLDECGPRVCDTGDVEVNVLSEDKAQAADRFDDYVCK